MEDMTFVRCTYPHAYPYKLVGWVIYDKPPTEDSGSLVIGRGETMRAAWADARKKIVDKYAAESGSAAKVPANEMILVDLSQFEDVARFAFNHAGNGMRSTIRAKATKMLEMISAQKKGAQSA